MLCPFAKSDLKGLVKRLFVYAHSCFIEVAGIAFVDVMRFDRCQVICALHLHLPPAFGGFAVLRREKLLDNRGCKSEKLA